MKLFSANIYFYLIGVFLLSACSSGNNQGQGYINDHLEDVAVEPIEEIVIEETDDLLFGSIGNLNVDGEGRIYVRDNQLLQVVVFDADGNLIKTIGRKGEGPGEFQYVRNLMVEEDGSFYVFDNNLFRVSYFEYEGDNNWVYQNQFGVQEISEKYAWSVYKTSDGFLVGSQMINENDQVNELTISLTHIDEAGEILNDEILTYIENQSIVNMGEDFIMIYSIPFSWESSLHITKDNTIYLGKSDSLKINNYDLDGNLINHIENSIRRKEVTSSDLSDQEITGSHPARDFIPDVHPAYQSFYLDNEDNLWFNLGEFEDGLNTWIMLNDQGELIKSMMMPIEFNAQVFRSNKVYGIYRDEDGMAWIEVYSIGIAG